MIDQLRPGMTRRQVRFIMGNPLLSDTFHSNRWDYLYSIQPGGGERLQERVSVIFDGNDQLAGLSGDFMPGVSRDQEILGETGAVPTSPQPQAEETPLRRARCWSRSSTTSTASKLLQYRPRSRWKPHPSRLSVQPKNPASAGFFVRAATAQPPASTPLALAALAARCLRTSFGSATSGR